MIYYDSKKLIHPHRETADDSPFFTTDIDHIFFQNRKQIYQEIPKLGYKQVLEFHFVFVITTYNNYEFVSKNIMSIVKQKYTNWTIVYVNDASTDKTKEAFNAIVAAHNITDKVIYIENESKMNQMYCKHIAYEHINDSDIVCILDGEDWLHDSYVLLRLCWYYTHYKCHVLTSTYKVLTLDSNGNMNIFTPQYFTKYSNEEIHYKLFRYCEYKFQHLKSGFGIYFKSIPLSYKRQDNKWIERFTDISEMICICELNSGKLLQLHDHMYIYNKIERAKDPDSFYRIENQTKDNNKKYENIKRYITNLPICSYCLPYVYVINLDKDTNNRQKILKMMKYLDLRVCTQFQFWNAIDGNESELLKDKYSEYIDLFKSNSFKNNGTESKEKKENCTLSALGLIYTTLNLYMTILNNMQNGMSLVCSKDHILILEDEVYASRNFNTKVFFNEATLKNKDFIYLGGYTNTTTIQYYDSQTDRDIFRLMKHNEKVHIQGCYSYIISKNLIQFVYELGLDFFIEHNFSLDLLFTYIRTNYPEFTFYRYFTDLFIPEVISERIIEKRGTDFYRDHRINLQDYFI
jgi:glycosyltransferase involved in cell wall biosynthesis